MKLSTVMKKLLAKHQLGDLVAAFLQVSSWDKLLLMLSNRCVGLAYHAKGKKKKHEWMAQARILHRAYDEITLEKKEKRIFKVSRRDIYECKCKKRFRVDAGKEQNVKYDLDKGILAVTCPHCGKSEEVKIC
jgi:hypothetical protein